MEGGERGERREWGRARGEKKRKEGWESERGEKERKEGWGSERGEGEGERERRERFIYTRSCCQSVPSAECYP